MKQVHFKVLLTILVGMVAVPGISAFPDDGDNLYVYTNEVENATVYSLESLDKITFTETGVMLWKADETREFSYGNLDLLMFSEKKTPTDIKQVDMSKFESLNNAEGIYDLQGRKLNTMQRGVNIIRMTDGTIKKVIIEK